MKTISIMIVDDHSILREALSSLLSQHENFEVLAQTGDAETVVEISIEKRPDIVLLDINMYPVNGFDMIKLIRKHSPLSSIICLSMHSTLVNVKKMLSLGAKGYLTKNSSATEMIKGIIEVYQGNRFVCSEIKNNLTKQVLYGEDVKDNINQLSQREIEVIKYLKEGQSSKQIATELKISYKTVEAHRHHILKKLNLKNTIGVVHYLSSLAYEF
jgi:two-component system invasion response regulator UvrY